MPGLWTTLLIEVEYLLMSALTSVSIALDNLTQPKASVYEDEDMIGYIMDGGI